MTLSLKLPDDFDPNAAGEGILLPPDALPETSPVDTGSFLSELMEAAALPLLMPKICRLCGERIVEARHDRSVSTAHLDTKHQGWRA